jgi:dihydrofolate reductase
MRNVVAAEYLTVDGVMQDPGGVGEIEHGGWSNPFWNDELATYQHDQLFRSDALLLGRVTYQGFAAAWPSMEKQEAEGDFAVRMNTLPKYVATRTERKLEWNASPIQGDVPAAVTDLKQKPGQDLLIYGSGELVRMLMQHNLIDEYRLMVHPVVLGSGKRLFDGSPRTALRLVDTKTTSTGVVLLTYQPAETNLEGSAPS